MYDISPKTLSSGIFLFLDELKGTGKLEFVQQKLFI